MTGNKSRGVAVQERDLRLLREIAEMRVIDREQAKIVGGFGSTTRVNTRLLGLTRAGLLRRFFLSTGPVAPKALYSISAKGAQLVGSTVRGPRRRQDETLVGEFAVQHQLAVNTIYCALKYRATPSDVTVANWQSFFEPIAPGVKLIPDGYAEVRTPARCASLLLEVDLGTEPLRTWTAKVASYLQYAASGEFERRFQQKQFRVLAIANSERRLESLRQATAAVTDRVFWFATLGDVESTGLWATIWTRPTDPQPRALLE